VAGSGNDGGMCEIVRLRLSDRRSRGDMLGGNPPADRGVRFVQREDCAWTAVAPMFETDDGHGREREMAMS